MGQVFFLKIAIDLQKGKINEKVKEMCSHVSNNLCLRATKRGDDSFQETRETRSERNLIREKNNR